MTNHKAGYCRVMGMFHAMDDSAMLENIAVPGMIFHIRKNSVDVFLF